MGTPLSTDQKERKMIPLLRKIGLSEDACARTARLLLAKPTEEEKRRWNQVGIMEDDKILVANDEMDDLAITVCIWDLMWQGKLVRVISDPIEIHTQKGHNKGKRHEKRAIS